MKIEKTLSKSENIFENYGNILEIEKHFSKWQNFIEILNFPLKPRKKIFKREEKFSKKSLFQKQYFFLKTYKNLLFVERENNFAIFYPTD